MYIFLYSYFRVKKNHVFFSMVLFSEIRFQSCLSEAVEPGAQPVTVSDQTSCRPGERLGRKRQGRRWHFSVLLEGASGPGLFH